MQYEKVPVICIYKLKALVRIRFLLLLTVFFVNCKIALSQNITGTWEGVMDHEYLIMNVIQQENLLCGFTHDYTLADRSSYCKAYFRGRYNPDNRVWSIYGVSFVENSGGHVLMELRFWRQPGMQPNTMLGTVSTGSSFFGMRNESEPFLLRRTSKKPVPPPGRPNICYVEPKPIPEELPDTVSITTVTPNPVPKATIKKTPPPAKKPTATKPKPVVKAPVKTPAKAPVKPVVKKPTPKPDPSLTKKPAKVSPPVAKLDTAKRISPAPAIVTPPKKDENIVKAMASRKKNEVSRLVVRSKNIELKLYDNGIVDNDTVSIFYNGKLLVNKQRLSESPLVVKLELDESVTTHEITMFALNLGSIPPNTALVVVTAGDKRYELHSSASLTENAVLVFEYKP